ncbi:MAG: hypothetical protein SGARI_003227, partial [Bacillariaceae sp.]
MVFNGGHALQIIDAVTRKPLREFRASDGTIWVEGQHGNEFFLQVEGPEGIRTLCDDIEVDGTRVGYHVRHENFAAFPFHIGVDDGQGNEMAMKFSRQHTSDGTRYSRKQIGVVSATWYDVEIQQRSPSVDRTWTNNASRSNDSTGNVSRLSAPVYLSEDKKSGVGALKAVVGSKILTPAAPPVPASSPASTGAYPAQYWEPRTVEYWKPTRRRVTLKIHYCEAAGLVARKIAKSSNFGMVVTPASQVTARSKKKRSGDVLSRNKKKNGAKPESEIETVDLTSGSPAGANPKPPAGEISYKEQVRALKKR